MIVRKNGTKLGDESLGSVCFKNLGGSIIMVRFIVFTSHQFT